jgi:thioredoxin-like negative regulator of GroEL
MGVYYERAKREAIEGNYRDAVKHLKSVVDAYPDATDVKIDLASAYLNSNQFSECEMILLGFEGTMVTTEESGRLNSIGRDVVAREQRFDTGDKASASPAPARGQR